MTDTSTIMKVLGGFGVLAAVIGPTFLVSQYVTDLQRDVSISKSEVERLKGQVDQLQDLLEKTQVSFSSSMRGPKGDKGDKGDTGERGEQGPRGERGPSGEAGNPALGIDVQDIIRRLEVLEKASVEPRSANTSVATSSSDSSGCVTLPVTQTSGAFLVSNGSRICGSSGEFLGQVEISKNVVFRRGGKFSTCRAGSPCKFLESEVADFVLDGVQQAADGVKQGAFSVYSK